MAKNKIQQCLFDDLDEMAKWKKEWEGMPEFDNKDLTPWKSIIVRFEDENDLREFSQLIGQKLTYRTRSIWFPEAEIGRMMNKKFQRKEEPKDEQ